MRDHSRHVYPGRPAETPVRRTLRHRSDGSHDCDRGGRLVNGRRTAGECDDAGPIGYGETHRAGKDRHGSHGDGAGDRHAPPGRGDRLRLRRAVRHQGAAPRRRRRDDGRQDHPPPVPAAALPGGDRHPVRGRDRAADPRGAQRPAERAGAARRGHRRSTSSARTVTSQVLGRDDRDAVRLADRGRRRRPVLLRQRPLRRVRARHEEHRRRPRAARPDLRRLRDGRARRQPRRRRRPPAHLRRRRRRPDRRRDGRPDRRARAPHPASATSARSTPSTPGSILVDAAPQVLPPFGAEARREDQGASWRSSASR